VPRDIVVAHASLRQELGDDTAAVLGADDLVDGQALKKREVVKLPEGKFRI
jgi:hypothetical protein